MTPFSKNISLHIISLICVPVCHHSAISHQCLYLQVCCTPLLAASATCIAPSVLFLHFTSPTRPTMPLDEVADFTTKCTRPIVCQRCHESFESETKLYFMHDRKGGGPGKHVCVGCHQYYLRKTKAMKQQDGATPAPGHQTCMTNLMPVGTDQNTQKAIAAAQRQGMSC